MKIATYCIEDSRECTLEWDHLVHREEPEGTRLSHIAAENSKKTNNCDLKFKFTKDDAYHTGTVDTFNHSKNWEHGMPRLSLQYVVPLKVIASY